MQYTTWVLQRPPGLAAGKNQKDFLSSRGRPRMPVTIHPGIIEDKGHLHPPESTELADLLRNRLAVQMGQGWSSSAWHL